MIRDYKLHTSSGQSSDLLLVYPHHRCDKGIANNFICNIYTTLPKPFPPPGSSDSANELLTHAKMYHIGEKYQVVGLKELARRKFKTCCEHYWNSSKFANAAIYAYTSTVDDDTGLRDVIFDTIYKHIALIEKPEDAEFMEEFGLTMSILKKRALCK
jgi:hypothetical protein